MSALSASVTAPAPDRAPSTLSTRSPSDTSLSANPRRPKDTPRSMSMRKAKTYSELQAPSSSTNGSLAPKPPRQASRGPKELRPLDRSATASFTSSSSALDPLSQHILLKTTPDPAKTQRGRNSATLEAPANDTLHRQESDATPKPTPAAEAPKKGPSLLSRLTMRGGKKKDEAEDGPDVRTNGTIPQVYSSAPGIGYAYIPHHKEPPRYIKFKRHYKKTCEFQHVFLAQKLNGTRPSTANDDEGSTSEHGKEEDDKTGGPVWAMAFSNDGKYLAAAGRDQVVRVFAVLSTREERRAHEEEEKSDATRAERLSAPVFRGRPIRELSGHTGEVLDLTWSKNNFLLSTAMDRTVRLWHMSRDECLCAFQHKEPVASVAFHPRDDRFFLAGSVDSTLRLWSIPDKTVAYSAQLSEVVTAVAFSPDGATCMAGTLHGLCLFYGTDGLKYQAQIHVRSSRGKNAKGSKVTGLHAMRVPTPGAESTAEVRVLVTSTDSRLRIYNLRDKSLVAKFKGHENNFTQMRARFSDDGRHIVCGSEDKKAYVWPWPAGAADAEKDKRPYESFDAHSEMLTAALFAPEATRRLLAQSGDPIYDLCNPPPVTLLSKEEANASQTALSDATGEAASVVRKPEESPAYIARSAHPDGNVIVTADRRGEIHVFRQDCASQKRRNENWETGSAVFGRKLGRKGRSGSVLTATSAGSASRSRRTSLSIGPLGREDRILSWRQGIEGPEREGSPVTRRAPNERRVFGRLQGSPVSSRGASRDGPPAPGFTFKAIDEDEEAAWSSRWKGRRGRLHSGHAPSTSSESDPGREGEAEGTAGTESDGETVYMTDEGDEARCEGCGGKEFRGDKTRGRQRFLCVGCGGEVALE